MDARGKHSGLVLACTAALGCFAASTLRADTLFTSEAAFISSAGTTLVESFETVTATNEYQGSTVVTPSFTVEHVGGGGIGVFDVPEGEIVPTDGTQYLRWQNLSPPSSLTFTFPSPTSVFGLTLVDAIEGAAIDCGASPSLSIQTDGGAVFPAALAGCQPNGSIRFLGIVTSQPFGSLTLSANYSGDGIAVDAVHHASAGGGSVIGGFVFDSLNGRPIQFVEVQASNLDTGLEFVGTTDLDGRYEIGVVGQGEYEVSLAHVGYHPRQELPIGQVIDGSSLAAPNLTMESRSVVMVHGTFSDHLTWSTAAFGLASQGWHVRGAGFQGDSDELDMATGAEWLGEAGAISQQATRLEEFLHGVQAEGIRSFSLVAHSGGGLVSRWYQRELLRRDSTPVIHAIIMLGSTNHGTELANLGAVFLQLLFCTKFPSLCLVFPAVPPVVLDQTASRNNSLLWLLNYDGDPGQRPLTNWACRQHPNESGLDSRTRYYTYAGTDWSCDSRPAYSIASALLRTATNCDSDQIVPRSSVPLAVSSTPGYVRNVLDVHCGCTSSHRIGTECIPMLEDPCVTSFVDDALANRQMCDIPHLPISASSGLDPEQFTALAEPFVLDGQAEVFTRTTSLGTVETLTVDALWMSGDVALTLLDPSGLLINPAVAANDPNIEYSESSNSAEYIVSAPASGEWRFDVTSLGVESASGVLAAFEASVTAVQVEISPLDPSLGQSVNVSLSAERAGVPVLGATALATVVAPGGVSSSIELRDDGVGVDEFANDGVYSAATGKITVEGVYNVEATIEGAIGGEEVVRTVDATFITRQRPDLSVSGKVRADVHAIFPDTDVVELEATIENIGDGSAETVIVQFVERHSQQVISETTLADIAPGFEGSVNGTWIARSVRDSYDVGVRILVRGMRLDTNSQNNERYRRMRVVRSKGIESFEDRREQRSHQVNEERSVPRGPFAVQISGSRVRFAFDAGQSAAKSKLRIYDIQGRRVATIFDGLTLRGPQAYGWDTRDSAGRQVAAGVYFARLEIGAQVLTSKVLVTR